MLPCRPLPDPGTPRRAHCPSCAGGAWPLALLLVLLAVPAHAFKLTSIRPARDPGNQLWVELRLEEPIESGVASSLERGMPATITLHAELWRKRNGWFDRMEQGADATFKMHYDVWSDTWRLIRPGMPMLRLNTLDSLKIVLARTLALNVSSLDRLPSDAPLYVVASVTLRPLNIEDVEEVELWLSGEVREKKRGPFGFLTRIPASIFDTAKNLAGFGDQHSRLISAVFTPQSLPRFTH